MFLENKHYLNVYRVNTNLTNAEQQTNIYASVIQWQCSTKTLSIATQDENNKICGALTYKNPKASQRH